MRSFSLPYLQFGGFRRLPLIRQTEAAECGLACLAMVAGHHGYTTDMTSLRRPFPISMKGATLENLIAPASSSPTTRSWPKSPTVYCGWKTGSWSRNPRRPNTLASQPQTQR